MVRRNPGRSKQRTAPGSVAKKSKAIDAAEEEEEEAFSITTLANSHADEPWPCLIICHGNEKKQILTFFNVSQQRHHSKVTRDLRNKYPFQSHGEWLVLQDAINSSDFCILNVCTMEKVQLPPLERGPNFGTYGSFLLSSSSPTTDANCCVFFIRSGWNLFFYCQIGAKQFSRQELNLGDDVLSNGIIFQGKIYCITVSSLTLYCSELGESSSPHSVQFREFINGETLKEIMHFNFNRDRTFLLESCGQLLYIDQFEHGTGVVDFQIFRADLIGKTWERVNDIGSDQAIFVDGWSSFSASVAGSGLKGNCIYFTEEDGTLNIFNLEDESVTMASPFPFDTQESAMRWLLIPTTNQK